MNNKFIIGVLVVLILIVGGYVAYSSGPIVSASGTSVIKATPDLVSVYINVETRNVSAQDAQNQNKLISNKLVSELKKLGFSESDLKFVNYNVYPDYDYNSGIQKQKGYVVYQQLVVKVSNVEKVPAIVDAAINSGALVSYINFELSDEKQKEYKRQALEQAGSDAKDKAESIAAGVGKRLGGLVSVESQDFHYPGPIAYYDKSAVAESDAGSSARIAAMNIAPQDIEVSADITVKYRLSPF